MCQPEKPLTLDGYHTYHEQPDNINDDIPFPHHEEIRQLTSRETIDLLTLVNKDDGMRAYILSLLRGAKPPLAPGIPY